MLTSVGKCVQLVIGRWMVCSHVQPPASSTLVSLCSMMLSKDGPAATSAAPTSQNSLTLRYEPTLSYNAVYVTCWMHMTCLSCYYCSNLLCVVSLNQLLSEAANIFHFCGRGPFVWVSVTEYLLVLLLVGAEILWAEEGSQFGFKRWQGSAMSCGSEFQIIMGPKARESFIIRFRTCGLSLSAEFLNLQWSLGLGQVGFHLLTQWLSVSFSYFLCTVSIGTFGLHWLEC